MTQLWRSDALYSREAPTLEEIAEVLARLPDYRPVLWVMSKREFDWWLAHPDLRRKVFGV